MRIQFLSNQVYEQGGPGKGPRFERGFVLDAGEVQEALGLEKKPSDDWVEGFLNRWVQRGVARVVDDKTPTGAGTIDGEAEGGEVAGDDDADEVDLDKLTRAELDALAADRGVDITSARNKGDVIDLLKAAERT